MCRFHATCKSSEIFQILVLLLTASIIFIHENTRTIYGTTTSTNVLKSNNNISFSNIPDDDNFDLFPIGNNNNATTSTTIISRANAAEPIQIESESIETETSIIHKPEIVKSATSKNIKQGYERGSRYIRLEGIDGMQQLMEYFFRQVACSTFLGNMDGEWLDFSDPKVLSMFDNVPTTSFDITFSCNELYQKSGYGTGNYLLLLYGLRKMSNQIGNINLSFSCPDAELYKDQLILPWLMGHFPRTISNSTSSYPASGRNNLTLAEACSSYSITTMIQEIQYELRRMAVAVTGIPFGTNHPSETWAKANLWTPKTSIARTSSSSTMQLRNPTRHDMPVPPTIEYDDVAIHFRCGDIVDSDDERFGFMKFTSIVKYISSEAKSIGIVTQPFTTSSGTQERELDKRNPNIHERCRKIVFALQDYLNTTNKNAAKISIHNDSNETIAVTYSRLIMANQTIISTSSFGAIAGLASFGTSYILNTDYKEGPNRWLLNFPNIMTITDNIVLIDEPILFATTVKSHWWDGTEGGEKVLDWLHNDEAELNNVTVLPVRSRRMKQYSL